MSGFCFFSAKSTKGRNGIGRGRAVVACNATFAQLWPKRRGAVTVE
jgi:hypothetical protein